MKAGGKPRRLVAAISVQAIDATDFHLDGLFGARVDLIALPLGDEVDDPWMSQEHEAGRPVGDIGGYVDDLTVHADHLANCGVSLGGCVAANFRLRIISEPGERYQAFALSYNDIMRAN